MADEEHLALLRKGVRNWNSWRQQHPSMKPRLVHAILRKQDLAGVNLRDADMRDADLRNADLTNADLVNTNCRRADFRGARLVSGRLGNAKLEAADLSESHMSGADLRGANLAAANLAGANLMLAKLSSADLKGADLSYANLTSADLHRGSLGSTRLVRSCLRSANLRGAYLGGAIISRADLADADVNEAVFSGTVFADVDLSGVRNLAFARHDAPSTLGLDGMLTSGGGLPDEFLSGCGYDPIVQRILTGDTRRRTDSFYEWLASNAAPLRLQSCFISYSVYDKVFVNRLQTRLNELGADYWYAPKHGAWGEEIARQIDREITKRDRVLLVCSARSLGSDWVRWEIDRTLRQEKERGKRVVFPVMLDDALLNWNDPRAARVREILAGDFRRATKGQAFERAFGRLVKGLESDSAASPSGT